MYPIPEDFGPVGAGADDDNALQAWAGALVENGWRGGLRPNTTYRTAEGIRLGTTDTLKSAKGIVGNGAKLLGLSTPGAVLDCAGIANNGEVMVTDLVVEGDANSLSSGGFLAARPEQDEGRPVRSSGRMIIENVRFTGHFEKVGFYCVSSESNRLRNVTVENRHGSHTFVLSHHPLINLHSDILVNGYKTNSSSLGFYADNLHINGFDSAIPPLLVSGFAAAHIKNGLINSRNRETSLARFQPGGGKNILDCSVINMMMHAPHKHGIEIGDPANPGGSVQDLVLDNDHLGNCETDIRVVNTIALYSVNFRARHKIDVSKANLYRRNVFESWGRNGNIHLPVNPGDDVVTIGNSSTSITYPEA